MNIRRRTFFRRSMGMGMTASLTGLPIAVVGVASDGFNQSSGVVVWTLFGASVLALGLCFIAATATHEIEESDTLPE